MRVDKKIRVSKVFFSGLTLLTTKKADDKIFVCKFSKNVMSKQYHIENSD